jgi:hypothetical protein
LIFVNSDANSVGREQNKKRGIVDGRQFCAFMRVAAHGKSYNWIWDPTRQMNAYKQIFRWTR